MCCIFPKDGGGGIILLLFILSSTFPFPHKNNDLLYEGTSKNFPFLEVFLRFICNVFFINYYSIKIYKKYSLSALLMRYLLKANRVFRDAHAFIAHAVGTRV